MKKFTIHAAKTNLAQLIDAALAGEDVVIAQGNRPVVRLVAIPQGRFTQDMVADPAAGPAATVLGPMAESEVALWQ